MKKEKNNLKYNLNWKKCQNKQTVKELILTMDQKIINKKRFSKNKMKLILIEFWILKLQINKKKLKFSKNKCKNKKK